MLGKQIEVAKSTWKDRDGGKGTGFVKSKVKKYICPDKNKLPVKPPDIPTLDNLATSGINRNVGQGVGKGGDTSRSFHSRISESNSDAGQG